MNSVGTKRVNGALLVRVAGRLVLAAVVVGSLTSTTLRAEEPSEVQIEDLTKSEKKQFLQLTQRAEEKYKSGEFEETIPLLKEAYEILPRANVLYRLALVHERAGQPRKALRYYRTYLERKPDTDKRGSVEATIANLEERVEQQQVAQVSVESTPSGAEVYVTSPDAATPEVTPRGKTPAELELNPGRVVLTLEKDDYDPVTREIDVEGGKEYTFSYSLEEPEPQSGADEADKEGPRAESTEDDATASVDEPTDEASSQTGGSRMSPVAPWTATAVGGAGAITGLIFYGLGRQCMGNRQSCTADDLQRRAVISYVSGGIGVLGLGTAAVLWGMRSGLFADRATGRGAGGVRVVLTPTGIQLRGTFK